MVNDPEPTHEARVPNPKRMLDGYFRATATLNLVRAFTSGGYGSLDRVYSWNSEKKEQDEGAGRYDYMVSGIRKAMDFMRAIGVDNSSPNFEQTTLYTSHEALLLDYEDALTRVDTTTGLWYNCGAHMLWIGDRTRQVDGAHVELLRGVGNPIGLKIGPTANFDEVVRVICKLNPANLPGRISLIPRFGASKVEALLAPLVKRIRAEGAVVTWLCDPMHGNTFSTKTGRKTRSYDDIVAEIRSFWQVHDAEGSVAAGVHLELTGDLVTECVGGRQHLVQDDLSRNYQTACDPRLNAQQAVELAFEIAEIIHPRR
jgi:3-deoxy-7-phosphoheptulonate synthase